MNPMVEKYIDAQKAKITENKTQEKNKILIDLGLCEKVYTDNTSYTDEFPMSEYDSATEQSRFYKIVPISVTDEEYSEF